MANEMPLNHHQNCLPVQFCAIKLAKTPKLFKVNVHENIHWLNQQELMVAEIGLKGGGRPRQRILMMQSFRLKLKQPDFTTSYPSCPDAMIKRWLLCDVWARNDFVSWIVKQFSM